MLAFGGQMNERVTMTDKPAQAGKFPDNDATRNKHHEYKEDEEDEEDN